jgi:signal transduction histidine kinase
MPSLPPVAGRPDAGREAADPDRPAPAGTHPATGRRGPAAGTALALGLPLLASAALLGAGFVALAGDQAEGDRAVQALDQAALGRDLHLAALQHREAARDIMTSRGTRSDLEAAAAHLKTAAADHLRGAARRGAAPEARRAADAAARGVALAAEAAERAGPLAPARARFEDAYAREVLPVLEDAARDEADQARAALASAQRLGRRRLALGAGASLLAVLVALAPALLHARRLSGAARRLRGAARRIGEGDFSPLPAGRGEMGALAEAMSQMASRLEAARDRERLIASAEARIQALEEGRAQLEARVEERTRALARTNADLADNLHRLSEAQQRLLVSERLAAIGQIAAAVAHEVNNPVSSVTSNLAFLAEEVRTLAGGLRAAGTPLDADREAEIAAAFGDAREAALRVARIVRDLGTIARGESEPLEPVDLHRAVEAAINVAQAGFKHHARVERHLGDVPPVQGSVSRLGQVFLPMLLLAGHSIAARGPGARGLIRVSTWTDPEGPAAVEIADDGPGMSAEALAHLFDPFGPLLPSGPAFGLGLAVAHGIVSSLGGTIEVKSAAGAGTTFRVAFPAARPPAAGPVPELRSAPAPLPGRDLELA